MTERMYLCRCVNKFIACHFKRTGPRHTLGFCPQSYVVYQSNWLISGPLSRLKNEVIIHDDLQTTSQHAVVK